MKDKHGEDYQNCHTSIVETEPPPSLRDGQAYGTSKCSLKKEHELWPVFANYVANTLQ
jgi:hypothetical protein